jgi:predicted transcriptional regulator
MLTAFALASQENILELMDQSKEGRDLLNSIYLELHTAGPNLELGKVKEVLTIAKQNARKSENRQNVRMARSKKNCHKDKAVLRKHVNANEKHEFTINRHLNANKHAINKNHQFIARSKAEFDNYAALSNLLKANRDQWNRFIGGKLTKMNNIIKLLRKARRHLINQHKAAMGTEFVEVKPETIAALSELRVEIANIDDSFDGLRPIINSLLQTIVSPPRLGKNAIRQHLIRVLKAIIKSIRKRRDLLEQQHEAAKSIFEALLKSFDENKTRVSKLLERLAHEKNLLEKRQGALAFSYKRAHRITVLASKAAHIRGRQCHRIKVRNAKLHVSLQKIKSIVAQIEEILQERFGKLKTFFLQRQMKFDEKQ